MAEKRRGLGRGLGALIPNNTTPVVTASDVAEKEAEKKVAATRKPQQEEQAAASSAKRPKTRNVKPEPQKKICPEKGTVCDNETDRTAREPHLFVAKGYGSEASGIFC